MADKREQSSDEQEEIGRPADEPAKGAADDEFEDVDDLEEDEEDQDEAEAQE